MNENLVECGNPKCHKKQLKEESVFKNGNWYCSDKC